LNIQISYTEQDRKNFELQAVQLWGDDVNLSRHPDGDYCNSTFRHRWQGWLAMLEFSSRTLPPAYETDFQEATTQLVMRHIDRMNDVCAEDPAERIVASFTSQFEPLLNTYTEKKFPGREAELQKRTA
jgi:hypothetical protein